MLMACLVVVVIAGTALSALAVGGYLSQFNAQYGTAGTKLDSCTLCHGAGGPPNNPYGAAYAANGHNYTAIEQLDSDGDGYTNLEEITAGTHPGDPNDFPNAPPADVAFNPTEGTIGTEVVITGSGFGSSKGKVILGPVYLKVKPGGWTDTQITTTVKMVIPPENYNMTVYPHPYTSPSPILLPTSFTMKGPELNPLVLDNGSPLTEISITGKFFSTKGRVYIEGVKKNGKTRLKRCKVTYWFMDPATGDSELRFLVPTVFVPGTYPLTIVNKVDTVATNFTINP